MGTIQSIVRVWDKEEKDFEPCFVKHFYFPNDNHKLLLYYNRNARKGPLGFCAMANQEPPQCLGNPDSCRKRGICIEGDAFISKLNL
jgi:hypothetical protein